MPITLKGNPKTVIWLQNTFLRSYWFFCTESYLLTQPRGTFNQMIIRTNFKISNIMYNVKGKRIISRFQIQTNKNRILPKECVYYFAIKTPWNSNIIKAKYVFKYFTSTQNKMPEDAAEKYHVNTTIFKKISFCVCYKTLLFHRKSCHIMLSSLFSCQTLDPEYGSKTGNEWRLKFSYPRSLCCYWAVSCSLLYLVFSTSWLEEKYAFSAPTKCCGLKVKVNLSCRGCGTKNLPLNI